MWRPIDTIHGWHENTWKTNQSLWVAQGNAWALVVPGTLYINIPDVTDFNLGVFVGAYWPNYTTGNIEVVVVGNCSASSIAVPAFSVGSLPAGIGTVTIRVQGNILGAGGAGATTEGATWGGWDNLIPAAVGGNTREVRYRTATGGVGGPALHTRRAVTVIVEGAGQIFSGGGGGGTFEAEYYQLFLSDTRRIRVGGGGGGGGMGTGVPLGGIASTAMLDVGCSVSSYPPSPYNGTAGATLAAGVGGNMRVIDAANIYTPGGAPLNYNRYGFAPNQTFVVGALYGVGPVTAGGGGSYGAAGDGLSAAALVVSGGDAQYPPGQLVLTHHAGTITASGGAAGASIDGISYISISGDNASNVRGGRIN